MFMELPEFSPTTVPVTYNGRRYDVRLRASYARPLVRDSSQPGASWPDRWKGRDAGNTPWGKHAAQNSGVSLIRAHREIQLDDSWVSHDDPRERWWTVEVDFPTALDEVFGVTNNKQGTMTFQRLAAFDWRREALDGEESFETFVAGWRMMEILAHCSCASKNRSVDAAEQCAFEFAKSDKPRTSRQNFH